jgi:hypothetical protein
MHARGILTGMSATSGNSTTLPGLRDAKAFAIVLVLGIYLPALILLVPAARPVALASAYVLPAGLALFAAIAFRLMKAGTARIPLRTFLAGACLITGGTGFDIIATLLHSPDLGNETNPVARFLLDSGHSVAFVLIYGGLCQSLLTLGSIFLWGGLLAQRVTIIESISGSFRSFPEFLKAILGGAKLTWKQWFFPWLFRYPHDRSEKYFYLPWPLATMLLGAAGYRWYCGIEWFGYSPLNRIVVGVCCLVLGVGSYFAWAWRAVQPVICHSANFESTMSGEIPAVGHSGAGEAAEDTK